MKDIRISHKGQGVSFLSKDVPIRNISEVTAKSPIYVPEGLAFI